MNGKRVLILLGVGLFALAVAELAAPGSIPLPASEALLSVVALATLAYAYGVFRSRRRHGPDRVATPEVELAAPTDVPGSNVEETIEGFPGTEQVHAGIVRTVRDGLREAAVAVLTRFEGDSPERARERIADGSWADEPYAAGFLSEIESTGDVSLYGRIRRLLDADAYRKRRVSGAADAIANIAGVPSDSEGAGEDGAPEFDPALVEEDVETGTADETGVSRDGVLTGIPRRTHRWTGVSMIALVCLGLGVLVDSAGVLLAGVAGVGFAAYARSSSSGSVDLSVSRSLSERDPDPGEGVDVTVTVTNEGRFCPDLRIVDGVPEGLAVTDGSPRYGTALRAGGSVSFSYTVTARQGTHEFGPLLAVVRNLPGSSERELRVGEPATIRAAPPRTPVTTPVPLRHQPTRFAGQAPTKSGGEGVEFRAVREYKPGDSLTRIDWNRRARTGELATLEFRPERAARVMILVDVRPVAVMGHAPDAETAVERAVDAAGRIFSRLLDDGHRAGIAAFGPAECYLRPGSGRRHRQRGHELLGTDPAFQITPDRADSGVYHWERRLRRKLPDRTQLLVVSPLTDTRAVRLVREFEAHGYPTAVLSPDPTAAVSPTHRLARARRLIFLRDLRQAGIPVMDWRPTERLETVLQRGQD